MAETRKVTRTQARILASAFNQVNQLTTLAQQAIASLEQTKVLIGDTLQVDGARIVDVNLEKNEVSLKAEETKEETKDAGATVEAA